jgi:hypothetical protein
MVPTQGSLVVTGSQRRHPQLRERHSAGKPRPGTAPAPDGALPVTVRAPSFTGWSVNVCQGQTGGGTLDVSVSHFESDVSFDGRTCRPISDSVEVMRGGEVSDTPGVSTTIKRCPQPRLIAGWMAGICSLAWLLRDASVFQASAGGERAATTSQDRRPPGRASAQMLLGRAVEG